MEKDSVISAIITIAVIIIIAGILYFSIPESSRNIKQIGNEIYDIFEDVFGIKAKKEAQQKEKIQENQAIAAFNIFTEMLECSKMENDCLCKNPGLGYEQRFPSYLIFAMNHPTENKVSLWLFEQSSDISHLQPSSLKDFGKSKPIAKKEIEGINLYYLSNIKDKGKEIILTYSEEDITLSDSGGILGAPYLRLLRQQSSSRFEDIGYPFIYSINETQKAIIGTQTKGTEKIIAKPECVQKNNDLLVVQEMTKLEVAALNCKEKNNQKPSCGSVQLMIPEDYIIEQGMNYYKIYYKVLNNVRFSTFSLADVQTYCYTDGLPRYYDKNTVFDVKDNGCVEAYPLAEKPRLLVSLSGTVYFIDEDKDKKNVGRGTLVTLNYVNENEQSEFPWGRLVDYEGSKIIRTDENGAFSFANIPEGTYILKANSEDYGLIYKQVTLTGQPLEKKTELIFFASAANISRLEHQIGLPPVSITASAEALACIKERGITTLSAAEKFQKIKALEFNGKTYWQMIQETTPDKDMQVLLASIMATETSIDRLAISSTGCSGLMQFCYSTAKDFPQYFSNLTKCCPKDCSQLDLGNNNRFDEGDKYACAPFNDDRFDPEKSIKAAHELLNKKISFFDGICLSKVYSDKRTFGIAAYNGGEATICKTIISSDIDNPSWEEVKPYLTKHVTKAKAKEIGCYPYIVGAYESYFSAFG